MMLRNPFDASWRERIAVLGTAAAILLIATALGLIYARGASLELLGLVPVSAFAVGKFLPLWGLSDRSQFSPWELGLLVWVMDTLTVLVLVYGFELLYRIRLIKNALGKIQRNAGLVLRAYPRIRRAAVTGVVLFVLFPIAGTGAIGGAFLGILLGLNRFVLIAAVSGGGFIGGMLMAFAAVYFGEAVQNLRALQSDPTVKWAVMITLGALLIAGFWWLNRAYKRALLAAEEQSVHDEYDDADVHEAASGASAPDPDDPDNRPEAAAENDARAPVSGGSGAADASRAPLA
ncbi:small multi-drug export protein [Haliangium ochraceum]|uniref:Small multi-drug export protein n=1 Tax=Haliangium ochraceum (strain DSM 14365 / JCM 11303 / SMP-2) TaxID=502025 RepID=D0LRR8_HALO1|nr:small multi-drug export protein [Haliangium ochraceum]ACY19060.1 hypothetical protein Hoch_6594 [Haliangium ochraceum DSM 14365]